MDGARKLLIETGRSTEKGALRKPPGAKVWISRRGVAMAGALLSLICYRLTWVHLVHHPAVGRGVPGVEPFGVHAVRHVVATHILKTTGNLAAAAAQLQDTEETTASTYAKWLPENKTALATAMLERDRAPPLWSKAA